MSFEYSPYILPLIAAAFVSAVVAIYAWLRRSASGALVLFLMAASVFVWSLGYSVEIAGTGLETRYFGGVIQYVGIAFAPYFWLMFSIVYSGQTKIISRRFIILTAIIPAITLGLALTTKWHGLIWNEYHVNRQNGFSALDVSHGLWFKWVHLPYSYIILLIGMVLLARVLWRRQGMYRGQIIALLVAVLAPVIGNMLYLTGNSPIPYLDLTPFAFTVSVAALAWAIFGFHLVDITPIARDRVVDSMREGMIVLDARGNIVDINNAAARMIGVPVANAIGKTAGDVFSPWSHLVERFRDVLEAKDEISVGEGEAKRTYEVRLSPLQDQQGQFVGRVIMLRAMDDEEIPQPRFAMHEPVSRPLVNKILETPAVGQGESSNNIWEVFKRFFLPPIRYDLPVRAGANPIWERTLERILTVLLRVAAAVGTIAAMLMILPSVLERVFYVLLIIAGIVFLWVLGLWRSLPVPIRTGAFLLAVYSLAFVEMFNFGYSVEAFVYFVFIVVFGVLLGGARGGLWSLAISFVTLSVFGWLITQGIHYPPAVVDGKLYPIDFSGAVISITAYSASSVVLIVSINLLVRGLDFAWQKETQTLNLLQQERDLLEQRVEERTHDLGKARDDAIKSKNELQKYFLAIEQSGNSIIITDRDGVIEYVNPVFSVISGYTFKDAIGKTARIFKSGDHDAAFYKDLWDTLTAGRIWYGKLHNKRKDGSLHWESTVIAPVKNHLGEITNYVAIKEDITEQKYIQDQLRQQNDYLSILHQITLDLLNRREIGDLLQVIVDRSAILLDAPFSEIMFEEGDSLVVEAVAENQSSVKGERVTRDQAKLSWQAFDTHQPVTLEDYATWEYHRELYDAHPLHATARFPVMAGDRCLGVLSLGRFKPNYKFTAEQVETGILFARLVALVLDNANLYDSAMKEIAERKRTETLLQESEARFRQIVENAGDIIYRADINGNFTYANPAALKMMGYSSEQEMIGKNYLDLIMPELRHKLKRIYDHQYISKTKSTYYEFPAVAADGETVWVGQNVQLIMDSEQIIGFQAVARNITQLKQTQEALALSRDHALDASRFKSQLLSRVSHELRTPLGGILGYAELLQYKAFGPLTEKQHSAINNVIESTHYLTGIVNDLLDEAQIESKSLSLHNKYFTPIELLEKAKTTMSTLADKKGLTFRVEIASDLPSELYGDINRLQQVIVNLAGNAIKFTYTGEVSVSLKRPAPAQWSIEVRDTGAGIAVEEQQNIFEPFRQVSNSITRENRGSGLGLAITRQLVELMDGQISLESELGKGSLFTVTLPITNAPGE